jgi:hypothetical protein
MKNKKYGPLSDETLNSLVDNEFPVAERAELLAHLQSDEASQKRACEINNLKDRVRTAYGDIPQVIPQRTVKNSYWTAKVASVFFALVVIGLAYFGLNSGLESGSSVSSPQRIVMLDPDGRGQQLSQNKSDEMRVVFHVPNSTRLNADELLDDIESLLKLSIQNHQQVRVEVVAHAAGLDLLREKLSTEKTRIAEMSKHYPELTFVACLNTVARIKQEQGIEVTLIPDALATQSGVAHVIMRQNQGWLYIKV